jgi:hypothetical protein
VGQWGSACVEGTSLKPLAAWTVLIGELHAEKASESAARSRKDKSRVGVAHHTRSQSTALKPVPAPRSLREWLSP